jgi:hypothetical protein
MSSGDGLYKAIMKGGELLVIVVKEGVQVIY